MPNPVLIVGMHRSGTSCLAGCLEDAGLFLGDVNRRAPFNKKGNNENRDIMAIHDRVLKAAGGTWDRPPDGAVAVARDEAARLDAIVGRLCEGGRWGMKDPRATLLIDYWQAQYSMQPVGTFRHPLEVVASLQRRADAWNTPMSKADALTLWERYNQALINAWLSEPFPIVQYGAPDYTEQVRSACRLLGLNADAEFRFYENELRTNHAEQDVPDQVHGLWFKLIEASKAIKA